MDARRDNFAHLVGKFFVNFVTLSLADFLQEDLLYRLGSDATKGLGGWHFHFARWTLHENLTTLTVDRNVKTLFDIHLFACGHREGLLEGVK